MKEKATKRRKKKTKGSTNLEPRINDKVQLRCQHTSDERKVSSANLYKTTLAHHSSPTQFCHQFHDLSDMLGKDKRQM